MPDFEISNVDLYAQYGSQRVTSVPVGQGFEIHVNYTIKNNNLSFLTPFWSTAMTVFSNSELKNIDADIYGLHNESEPPPAADAINVTAKPEGTTYYLVQIFANQAMQAGVPPDDMWFSTVINSDPTWVRLYWGIIGIEAGAGALFSGEITSFSPTQLKVGQPLQITIGYLARGATDWIARAIVTIAGVTKSVDSSFHLAGDGSGNLLVSFGTMPANPVDGTVILRIRRGGISSYYEDVDSQSFQVLVTEELPPPDPGGQTLYGQVKDSATQVVLVSVKVTAGGGTAYTNTSGSYVLSLAPGQYQVTFSKTGYQTLTQSYTIIEGSNLLNVQMVKTTAPPPGDGGQACSIDADCPTDYVCKNGVCVKKSILSDLPSWALPVAVIVGGALLLWPSKKKRK